jgi:outer membrane protein
LSPHPIAGNPTGIPKEHYTRMKRSLALIVTLASGFVLSAAAQTTPAPAPAAPAGPAKVAVIAFQATVYQTNEGQRNFGDLQKKYAPREAQLKALNDEIDTLVKQLQAQGDKLSDAERASRSKIIDDKKKQLDRSAEDLKNDGTQEMADSFQALASKVYDVLASYAQQQGYTLVLDISQSQQAPLVLYASPATDISKAVLEAYNLKSGVPAPPPSAPTPAAAKPPAGQ